MQRIDDLEALIAAAKEAEAGNEPPKTCSCSAAFTSCQVCRSGDKQARETQVLQNRANATPSIGVAVMCCPSRLL